MVNAQGWKYELRANKTDAGYAILAILAQSIILFVKFAPLWALRSHWAALTAMLLKHKVATTLHRDADTQNSDTTRQGTY